MGCLWSENSVEIFFPCSKAKRMKFDVSAGPTDLVLLWRKPTMSQRGTSQYRDLGRSSILWAVGSLVSSLSAMKNRSQTGQCLPASSDYKCPGRNSFDLAVGKQIGLRSLITSVVRSFLLAVNFNPAVLPSIRTLSKSHSCSGFFPTAFPFNRSVV